MADDVKATVLPKGAIAIDRGPHDAVIILDGTYAATVPKRLADAIERLQDRIDKLESIIERVANLAGYKWPTDRLTYPDSEVGQYAATAVRLCEDELQEALHGE